MPNTSSAPTSRAKATASVVHSQLAWHRHQQRLDRLVRPGQRVARMVEPVVDHVAEVGRRCLSAVDGGVAAADGAYGEPRRGEGLARPHRDRLQVRDVGAGRRVHRCAQPDQSQRVHVIGVLVRDEDRVGPGQGVRFAPNARIDDKRPTRVLDPDA
jgi:hypothetical protein